MDDNPAALLAVSALCQSLGYDVDEADGPLAAIELFENKTYDLVVSDINMPGDINGIHLARILQRRNSELAVILMTGYADSMAEGAGDFVVLAKPFDAADLRKAIR